MLNVLTKFFDSNEKEVNKLNPLVLEINSLEEKTKKLKDSDFPKKTKEFKEQASRNMCKYNENIISNHKIKYYKSTKLYYQSLHEYRFLEYCEKHDILQYLNNSPTFKYLNVGFGKWHLPDFKYKEDVIVEIKSSYWLKRQGGWNKVNAKKESVENAGYLYIFILDENYDNFLNFLCLYE